MAKVWKAAVRDERDLTAKMVPCLPAPLHLHQKVFLKRIKLLVFRSGQICLNCGLEVRGTIRRITDKNLFVPLLPSLDHEFLPRGQGICLNNE